MARGKIVYNTVGKCNTCHIVNKEGKEVGPDLSEIGSKLSREAMFESILFPSAGISHNYETWTAATDAGNVVTGIKVSETATESRPPRQRRDFTHAEEVRDRRPEETVRLADAC